MRKSFRLTLIMAVFLLSFTFFTLPCLAVTPDMPAFKSMIVYDLSDDKIIFESNTDLVLPPSSFSKLITGALSYQLLADRLNENVMISEQLLKEAPKTKLKAGTELSVRDLVRLTVCQRNNDAAYVLASYCCGSASAFVSEMNIFAAEKGCELTDFANPAGLEYGSYCGQTTVRDLTVLIKEIISNAGFLSLFDENSYTVGNVKSILLNKGMTDTAGYCRITLSAVNDHNILCVVMGSESEDEAQKCTDTAVKWIYSSFSDVAVLTCGQTLCTIPVKNGAKTAEVNVVAADSLYVFTDDPDAVKNTAEYEVHLFTEEAEAPLSGGTYVGSVTVTVGNTVVGNADVVTEKDVEANSFSLAVYRFGLALQERRVIASICMMIFLFILYFAGIYRKNRTRQIMLQRYRNEHKDIYK